MGEGESDTNDGEQGSRKVALIQPVWRLRLASLKRSIDSAGIDRRGREIFLQDEGTWRCWLDMPEKAIAAHFGQAKTSCDTK